MSALPAMNFTPSPAPSRLPPVAASFPAGGAGGGLPFDFKAYRAAVAIGDDPLIAGNFEVDQDITWCSQWGKVIDLTFRLESQPGGSDTTFGHHLTWATITGIGITMSGYRQQIPMQIGLTAGDADTDSASSTTYAFEVVMINPGDYRVGYQLQNMMLFSLDLTKHFYVKGNVQLIGRTYFRDGELTFDPGDFQ